LSIPGQRSIPQVGFIGLGCAKNRVDGEIMLGMLQRHGVSITADLEQAEVIIVNTCGFITDAKQESVDTIIEVAERKRLGQVSRLVVAGCMSQAFARELAAEIPEIDAFIGLDELETVVDAVLGSTAGHIPAQRAARALYGRHQPRLLSTKGYAYLKIAEGCNNPCAFCTIPLMRGAFRSRALDDIVTEAQGLVRLGVHELNLVAQDTTRYGEDLGLKHGLTALVQRLLQGTEVEWIRCLYAYPATLEEGLLELMAEQPRVLSYLDIPLQHVSSNVLKAMRRGGSLQRFESVLLRARSLVPDLTVRTTFIVGYPSEGEQEFAELVEFVKAMELDHVGVFEYSWQEENPGAALGDPVAAQTKRERRDQLMAVQQEISLRKNRELVGTTADALVEGPLPEMPLLTAARLARHAPEVDGRLLINDGSAPAGSLVRVKITEAHPYDLVGTICEVQRLSSQPGSRTLPVLR